jgi:hypothetical protein
VLSVAGRRERRGALAVLGLLALAAPHVSALALGACTAVLIIAVAVLDYARNRRSPGAAAGRPTPATPAPEDPPFPLREAT